MRDFHRRLASAIVALGLAIGAAGSARADGLAISPMHVNLSATDHVGSVALTNQNDTPLRLEVAGFHWAQRTDGSAILEPSESLIVFPLLLTIPAHQARNVRLALTAAPAEREDAYQVSITELPSFTSPANRGVRFTFRMRANLAVFFAPNVTRSGASIASAAVHAGALTFVLANGGNVHFVAKDLSVSGLDAAQHLVFSQTLDRSDVLAEDKRFYRIPLSRKTCSDLRALTIRANAGDRALVETLAVQPGACKT